MMNRKKFNIHSISRRDFLIRSSAAAVTLPIMTGVGTAMGKEPDKKNKLKPIEPEWKNKQAGMAYRQLGRTGFMISEIVYGGTSVNEDNRHLIEIAIERGLNYLDTAPAYGRGQSEEVYGKVLNSPSKRDKVFLTTKISGFPEFRNRMYREIFDGLPANKQEKLSEKATQMQKDSGIFRPGYFVSYGNWHRRQTDPVFLSNAMMEEYGERVEGSPGFDNFITESLENSLKRVGTDHFDILMCPHATSVPEEVNNPFIKTTFDKLKKQGKVRFLGLSTHNDQARVLRAAKDVKYFDVCMLAYNIVNHGFLEDLIAEASGDGMGIIAMKAARAVVQYDPDVPIPDWRYQKLNTILPGDEKAVLKAYLFALQNPNLSAVISNMTSEAMVEENLGLAGRRVDLESV